MFKSHSVDSGLLLRVSIILEYDFFQYYSDELGDHVVTLANGTQEELTALRNRTSDLEKELVLKDKLIKLLEEKAANTD